MKMAVNEFLQEILGGEKILKGFFGHRRRTSWDIDPALKRSRGSERRYNPPPDYKTRTRHSSTIRERCLLARSMVTGLQGPPWIAGRHRRVCDRRL